MTGAPPWYIGTIAWNGRQVPLVSFEGACGQNIPPAAGRSRVVIFHCIGDKLEGGYFGVVSQGFPQLVRVSSDVVRPDNSKVFAERTPVICQVRMLNEAPLVPDIERLEEMIAEETRVALKIPELLLDDCERRQRRGLGPQDARPQRQSLKLRRLRGASLGIRQAALGPDQQRDGVAGGQVPGPHAPFGTEQQPQARPADPTPGTPAASWAA